MKYIIIILTVFFTNFTVVHAAKVDIYKNAIQNKTFTLKYKVNEFPIRSLSKKANFSTDIWDSTFYNSNEFYKSDVSTGGVIVVDGDNSYIEKSFDTHRNTIETGTQTTAQIIPAEGSVLLQKDGEMFSFSFTIKYGGKKVYYSESDSFFQFRRNKIKATTFDKLIEKNAKSNSDELLIAEYDYRNPDLYLALQPILPLERIIATPDTPTYKFIGSGNLTGGLSYEDFYGEKNNFHSAIRYYFRDDKMVKIATFNYIKDAQGVQFYERHVIDIKEFLTMDDESYLQLPEGLKDVTKRGDGGKK